MLGIRLEVELHCDTATAAFTPEWKRNAERARGIFKLCWHSDEMGKEQRRLKKEHIEAIHVCCQNCVIQCTADSRSQPVDPPYRHVSDVV